MPYTPAAVPDKPSSMREFMQNELHKIADEINNPNPATIRYQAHTQEPERPRAGDTAFFPAIAGAFSPGGGPGIYWFDGAVWRVYAGLEELAIMAGVCDNVVSTAVATIITNYALDASSDNMAVDPVAGTITLPVVSGWVNVSIWFLVNQVTNIKDFTVDINAGINGVPNTLIANAYIPQQSSDVDLVLSASLTRPVNGGEVMDFRMSSTKDATFEIPDSSIEIQYVVGDQGPDIQTNMPSGVIP